MRHNDELDNLLTALIPGGIERQEARGQREFVCSETMPKSGRFGKDSSPLLESLGIKVLGNADDLFYNVELPAGWRKQPTEHSMWNDLLDDKGRKRAAIFYKAAFYDRNAHMSVTQRYTAGIEPVGGWTSYRSGDPNLKYVGIVFDSGKAIWKSEELTDSDAAEQLAIQKVAELYPDYQNTAAYWD